MGGEFDGYVTPVAGGFEAGGGGVIVGVFEALDEAVRAAQKAAPDRKVWMVNEDGEGTEVMS